MSMPPMPPMPPAASPASPLLLLRLLGHHRLGGEQQRGDARGVLERRAHDLGRVDHAGLHQVLVLLGLGVEAEGALAVLHLVDHDRAVDAGVLRRSSAAAPRARGARCFTPARWSCSRRRPRGRRAPLRARSSATPPPGTMPSSTAARVACSASSTRAFFSFISVSVAAPTFTTATPPASFASRSWSFSRS